jgi:hypothetical protein
VVLLVPHFQSRLALAGAPLANWSDRHFGGSAKSGLVGQVSMGLLLGAVWRPRAGASSERANFIEAPLHRLQKSLNGAELSCV